MYSLCVLNSPIFLPVPFKFVAHLYIYAHTHTHIVTLQRRVVFRVGVVPSTLPSCSLLLCFANMVTSTNRFCSVGYFLLLSHLFPTVPPLRRARARTHARQSSRQTVFLYKSVVFFFLLPLLLPFCLNSESPQPPAFSKEEPTIPVCRATAFYALFPVKGNISYLFAYSYQPDTLAHNTVQLIVGAHCHQEITFTPSSKSSVWLWIAIKQCLVFFLSMLFLPLVF